MSNEFYSFLLLGAVVIAFWVVIISLYVALLYVAKKWRQISTVAGEILLQTGHLKDTEKALIKFFLNNILNPFIPIFFFLTLPAAVPVMLINLCHPHRGIEAFVKRVPEEDKALMLIFIKNIWINYLIINPIFTSMFILFMFPLFLTSELYLRAARAAAKTDWIEEKLSEEAELITSKRRYGIA